ncbi:MAG: hypothetical protein KDE19_16465, partial [Caldilineaceae bacterium]|nr:hypothetical protein [Caldilineaceae bacterium]
MRHTFWWQCLLLLLIGPFLVAFAATAHVAAQNTNSVLPPIVFVTRAHLATADTIFDKEVGPAG